MKSLGTLVCFAALCLSPLVASAANVLLEPTEETRETPLFTSLGQWTANGTDRPMGVSIRIKPISEAASFTWSLVNTSTSETYVAAGTYVVTDLNWLSLPPPDAQGYKLMDIAELNGAWSTPAAGNIIQFTLIAQPSTNHSWTTLTGAAVEGAYALTAPVPSPSSFALLLAGVPFVLARRYWGH